MEEQLEKLKLRIPYNEEAFESKESYETVLNQLLEDSKSVALSDLYPFVDWSEKELPKKLYNWQLRACVQYYNFLGTEGIKAYAENGLSYTKMEDGLSSDLINEIMPNVGYIQHIENEGETTDDNG